MDFYWRRLRACLEIDSVEWHFGVGEWTRTWDRHLDLTKFGYSVIHRPPSALREPARFCRDVADWLADGKPSCVTGCGDHRAGKQVPAWFPAS